MDGPHEDVVTAPTREATGETGGVIDPADVRLATMVHQGELAGALVVLHEFVGCPGLDDAAVVKDEAAVTLGGTRKPWKTNTVIRSWRTVAPHLGQTVHRHKIHTS
ncbi:hypothetical protein [Streptomyces sp. NPDC060035]|uniref:hypothetical protein n=1 Tax=Streptomyces sp. NPDC060035 TaxID=3347044 RepID=UPI0036BC674A